MTTQQLYLFDGLYLMILVVVAVLTRATARRIAGALAGGVVFAVAALGIIALGEKVGWWHQPITWEPYFLTLLLIGLSMCAFVFLITWPPIRLARAGRSPGRLGGGRADPGLLVHEPVSRMGQLWARGRHCPRGLRELRPTSGAGARGDAAGLWPGARGDRLARRPWESG